MVTSTAIAIALRATSGERMTITVMGTENEEDEKGRVKKFHFSRPKGVIFPFSKPKGGCFGK